MALVLPRRAGGMCPEMRISRGWCDVPSGTSVQKR